MIKHDCNLYLPEDRDRRGWARCVREAVDAVVSGRALETVSVRPFIVARGGERCPGWTVRVEGRADQLPEDAAAFAARLEEAVETRWQILHDADGDDGFDVRITAADLDRRPGLAELFVRRDGQ